MLAELLQQDDGEDGSGKVVLDVGCGEGYCARKAVELGATRVVGCDISEEMIASARDVADGDDRFRYFACPAGDLMRELQTRADELGIAGSPSGAFDVAIAVFLFNYLTSFDMEDAVAQVYQALKPGGTFIFSVPHPSMIYCHDEDAVFHLDSAGKGYYSARNEKLLGRISTVDGTWLNVMSVHKTLGDYVSAIRAAGFEILDISEAGVTEEHMKLHPEFFKSVYDRPLHLVFRVKKRVAE